MLYMKLVVNCIVLNSTLRMCTQTPRTSL